MAGDEERGAGEGSGRSIDLHLIAVVALAGALASFIGQNTQEVEVTWLTFDFSAPLWVLLGATIVLSVLLGTVLSGLRRRRR